MRTKHFLVSGVAFLALLGCADGTSSTGAGGGTGSVQSGAGAGGGSSAGAASSAGTSGGTAGATGASGGAAGMNPGVPRGRLRVAHGKLVDERGEPVALEGLGLGAIEDVEAAGHWNEDYFAAARAWNAEMVRLPVNPAYFRADPDRALAQLDDAVRWSRAHDLYLIIDYHIIGNVPQGLFLYDVTGSTWEETQAFWATVAARYAEEPTVAFLEIYNEPAALDFAGGSWAFADWQTQANEIVAIVRENAPDAIPLVAGLDFAYDLSAGGDSPFADPDIALAAHPYPGKARSERSTHWDAAFGYLSERYPIVLTEVGFDPYDMISPSAYRADLDYGRDVVSYAREKGMSWAAFVFFKYEGWPMPLISDWENLTPTVPGLFFKDVLAGEAVATAGDGFGERPPVLEPPANGPGDLYWNKWAHDGASAEWLEPPTLEQLALHVDADPTAQAGMYGAFEWDNATRSLSQYNQAVLLGTIAEGSKIAFTIGRNVGSTFYGCSWDVVGAGASTYTVDLLAPDWCGPSTCFDLVADGLGFSNAWSQSAQSVDITIQAVELVTDPERPLPAAGAIGTSACE